MKWDSKNKKTFFEGNTDIFWNCTTLVGGGGGGGGQNKKPSVGGVRLFSGTA